MARPALPPLQAHPQELRSLNGKTLRLYLPGVGALLDGVRVLTERAQRRVDQWLWFARFFKTRSSATRLVGGGGVRVNGTPISKAAAGVATGDVLTFAQGRRIRVIRVLALGDRRGPATEAVQLYEDLAPEATSSAQRDAQSGVPAPGAAPGRDARRAAREIRRGGLQGSGDWHS